MMNFWEEEEEERKSNSILVLGMGMGLGMGMMLLLVGGRMETIGLLDDQLHLGLLMITWVATTCRSCQAPGKMKRLRDM